MINLSSGGLITGSARFTRGKRFSATVATMVVVAAAVPERNP